MLRWHISATDRQLPTAPTIEREAESGIIFVIVTNGYGFIALWPTNIIYVTCHFHLLLHGSACYSELQTAGGRASGQSVFRTAMNTHTEAE